MNNDLNQNLNNNITPQPMPNTEPVPPQPIPNPVQEPIAQPMNQGMVTPQEPVAQPMNVNMVNPMPEQSINPQQMNMGGQVQNPMPDQQPVQPMQMEQPQQVMNPMPQEQAPQKPPKQKSNPVLIVLMFIAIIGGAIYFGYNYFFANKTTKSNNTNSGTTVTDNTNEIMQNDEAKKIVKDIVKKYNQPYGIICGEVDFEDNITESDKSYSASKTYKTIEEIDTYLASFLSSDFITANIDKTKYLEKEEKLYCNIPQRGTLIYDEEGSTYTITDLTTESIAATGTISYTKEGGETETYPVELSLIKENDSWLLNSYKETR